MRDRFVCYIVLAVFFLSSSTSLRGYTQNRNDKKVNIVAKAVSPSKEYIATNYVVSGGGAAGYVYKLVNIRRREEPFNLEKGIIFQVTGTVNITLKWEDNEHLTIKYSKGSNVYTQEKEWGKEKKINIKYVAE